VCPGRDDRTIAFRTIATPRIIATRTIATRDNYHLGHLLPGTIASYTIATRYNCNPEQLPPRTIATQDNSTQANCHPKQLPPGTIATWDNCHPDNCLSSKFHLYNPGFNKLGFFQTVRDGSWNFEIKTVDKIFSKNTFSLFNLYTWVGQTIRKKYKYYVWIQNL
jgi:hypothetical protein